MGGKPSGGHRGRAPFRKRTKARQYAVQMLYCSEMTEDSPAKTAENFWKSFPGEEQSVMDFAENLLAEAHPNISQDDALIGQFISKNWSFDRVGLVEKCIMRLAVNELFRGDAPVYAVMDDYVTLAKSFGDDKSASFVNGVLESIRVKFSIERGNDERKEPYKD